MGRVGQVEPGGPVFGHLPYQSTFPWKQKEGETELSEIPSGLLKSPRHYWNIRTDTL